MATIKSLLKFAGQVYVANLIMQAIFKFAPIPDNIKAIIIDPIGTLLKK